MLYLFGHATFLYSVVLVHAQQKQFFCQIPLLSRPREFFFQTSSAVLLQSSTLAVLFYCFKPVLVY